MESLAFVSFLVLTVPLTGLLTALIPYLTPKNECFAVTVPEGAYGDGRLAALRRRYARICMALAAVGTAAVAAAAAVAVGGSFAGDSAAVLSVTVLAAMLVLMGGSFLLMLRYRRKVVALKRAEGWFAPRREAAALVGEDEDIPRAIPLAWNLLYIPAALLVAGIGLAWYPAMPDMVPMHMDFEGNVTRYEPKSLGVVLFPVALIVFLAVLFAFAHWGMLRSKRPTNPNAPVTSALAYGMFVRAQSIYLLASGLLMSVVIGLTFVLSVVLGCAAVTVLFVVVVVALVG